MSDGIRLWAGSQESWNVVLRAQAQVADQIKAGKLQAYYDEDRDGASMPKLYEVRGDTAVISICGTLVDGHAGWMRYYGVIGYDDISKATIQAASNADIKRLMFFFDTEGGDVNGLGACANLLRQVTALKASSSYTGTTMHSGGYWLASAVKGQVYAGETASVGSIGVITVQTNYADADKQAGIDRRVVRAGKFKAELNAAEKPSDEAIARLQSKADYVHGLFRAAVQAGRPNLSGAKLLEVTEGQTFLGPEGKSAGLVDKITTFEQALKLLDSTKSTSNTSSTSKGVAMAKVSELTPEQLQAIAGLGIQLDVEAAAPVQAAAAPVVAAAPAAAPAVDAGQAAVMTELRAQLAAKDTELVTAKAELANLKASAPAQDALVAATRKEISRMLVALKASDAALEAMDAAALAAEHTRVSALFEAQFKPGGVGAPAAAAQEEAPKVDLSADPMFLARLQHAPSANRQ